MKSELNFVIKYENGETVDMDNIGLWVESFHIYSPNVERELLEITGMNGAYLGSSKIKVRRVVISFQIESDSILEMDDLKHLVYSTFYTEESFEIIRDIKPDKIIKVMQEGEYDIENITDSDGEFTIELTMLDPHLHGTEQTLTVPATAPIILTNEGTAETEPIITCTINQDTTYVAVSDGGNINMIGMPTREEETPFEPETQIYKSDCSSLNGWVNATSTEGYDNTGVLKTNGSQFYTDDYGVSNIWHGPAMKTSLATALQGFRFDVGFFQKVTGSNQAGGITVSLLDANNNFIARMSMFKHFGGLSTYYATFQVGSSTRHNIMKDIPFSKDVFSGVFRLYRDGNEWTAQIFEQVNGLFQSPITQRWTDSSNIASASIAQVQLQLLARSSFPVIDQKIDDILLYQINENTGSLVPIIAYAGDVIEFNHQVDIIRRNGEDITKEKAFIGDYFALKPGQNTIIAEPADAIEKVEVRWPPKWL